MIFRSLLVLMLLFYSELFAESKTEIKIEAGIFMPNIDGSIENVHGSSDFQNDYVYSDATASYFAADLKLPYKYAPNVMVKYFYMQENANSTLDKNVTVADGFFNSKVSTVTDFAVLNTILYKDFKQKGKIISLLGRKVYSGDFEFDVGLNVKVLMWNFEIIDQINLSKSPSWIHVQEFIPLPYIGFKYHLYRFSLFADASALSFVEAKAFDYQVGASFRVVSRLSLSGSYVYEKFKAVEKLDTVNFTTSGYKFSFIYTF